MPGTVLLVGLEPALIDFSDPAFKASPGLDAFKVQAGLDAAEAELNALGYDARWLLIDTGETAEAALRAQLAEKPYDCVLIGGGVRTLPVHFLLFEKLINVIHQYAPNARICFNTNPGDTTASVRRWV